MDNFCNYCCSSFESEHLSRISENEFDINFKLREAFKVEIDTLKFCTICKKCEEKVEASYQFYQQILEAQQNQTSFVKIEPIEEVVKVEYEDFEWNQTGGSGYTAENYMEYNQDFGNESYEDQKRDFNVDLYSPAEVSMMKSGTYKIPSVTNLTYPKQSQIPKFGRMKTEIPEYQLPALPHQKPFKPKTVRFRKGMPGYKSHASKGLIRPKAAAYSMSEVFDEEIERQKFYDVPEILENLESNPRIWSQYKWICTECEVEFDNVIDLQAHLHDWHDPLPYRENCLQCDKKSTNFTNFLNHAIEEHHPNLKFCCVICSQHHQNFIDLFHHHQTEHPTKKIYFCLYCGLHFPSCAHVKNHAILKHNRIDKKLEEKEKFQCDYCGYESILKSVFSAHIKIHKEKTIQCDKCTLMFRFHSQLKYHQKESHPEAGSEVICTECGKNFCSMRKFRNHYRIVHNFTKNHICNICNRAFRTNQVLQRHLKTHDPNAVADLQCPHCEKKYKHKPGLEYHIRTHFGEKPYLCPLPGCEYRAFDYANANKHIKSVHKSDVKPIKIPSTPLSLLKSETLPYETLS